MSEKIRVRFAPSPTGYLHIGSLRTVLFDYLMARGMNAKLILRIEDTDQKREVKGAVDSLINILDWLDIKFDEGPHIGGAFGPYIQSQRLAIYEKYAKQLLQQGKVYRCFCTLQRLEQMRREQQAKKQPPRYDRTCRELSKTEIDTKLKTGAKFVIRQKMPLSGETVVNDELRGEIKFNNADLEDHVLIKSDGMPTYQFAVVVDDHLMEISHVLRGDEWISSFPKNILLYRDFGWQPPKFIHLALTLNKEGGKLSKRQGDVAVEDYRAKGYLAEALLNFSVLLGWHPRDEQEILSINEMIKKFAYHDLGTSPAVFDSQKLDYFNGWYIRHKPIDELARLCLPFLASAGIIADDRRQTTDDRNTKFSARGFCASQRLVSLWPRSAFGGKNLLTGEEINFDYIKKVVSLEQERLKKLSEIGELARFFFEGQLKYEPELLIWKKLTLKQVKENLKLIDELLEKIPEQDWTDDSIEEGIMSYLKAKNLKVGEYLWPMRAALTGRQASPGPFAVAEVLGKEKSLGRLQQAIKSV